MGMEFFSPYLYAGLKLEVGVYSFIAEMNDCYLNERWCFCDRTPKKMNISAGKDEMRARNGKKMAMREMMISVFLGRQMLRFRHTQTPRRFMLPCHT